MLFDTFVNPVCSLLTESWYMQTNKRGPVFNQSSLLWAFTDSNRRPSACKADALNQLS